MEAISAFAWGFLAGALVATALACIAYAIFQQLAIARYLRYHPEERAKLHMPGQRPHRPRQ